jgi:hypothetical protein
MVKNTKMVGISNKIKKEIDIIFMKKKDDANITKTIKMEIILN